MISYRKTNRARMILAALKKPEEFVLMFRVDKWILFRQSLTFKGLKVGFIVTDDTAEKLYGAGVEAE